MNRSSKTVKANPLAGKVKKLMQADEDVGKVAQGTPLLLGDICLLVYLITLGLESQICFSIQLGPWSYSWANYAKAQQQLPPTAMHGQRPQATCMLKTLDLYLHED